jgi:hypothetical protein
VLILDREHCDPKWILATVAAPRDVRPARDGADVDEVTQRWVASAAGLYQPALTPMPGAHVWRVDEGGRQRQVPTPRQRPASADDRDGALFLAGTPPVSGHVEAQPKMATLLFTSATESYLWATVD